MCLPFNNPVNNPVLQLSTLNSQYVILMLSYFVFSYTVIVLFYNIISNSKKVPYYIGAIVLYA